MKSALMSFLLFLLCTAMLASMGKARHLAHLRFELPQVVLAPRMQHCRDQVQDINVCAGDIHALFEDLPHLGISPACCEAIRGVAEECFEQIFENFQHPFFPYLLKAYCGGPAGDDGGAVAPVPVPCP